MGNDAIISEAQKAVTDTVVTLFDIDLTALGGGVLRFTPELNNPDAPVVEWRGENYLPLPVAAEGFETTSGGQFPRPKLSISNVMSLVKSEMITYNNFIGAEVTRWRTWAKHLDTGVDPDPDIYFPLDVYVVDRKSLENSQVIEFELSTIIDQQGIFLPRRQILRNTCTHVYRIYDTVEETFDYSRATCPYGGTNYFNDRGEPVSLPAEDACSKLTSTGCKNRFPNEPLPTRAFPGVGRFR